MTGITRMPGITRLQGGVPFFEQKIQGYFF